jgi:predicted O-methyltransferase YrrM
VVFSDRATIKRHRPEGIAMPIVHEAIETYLAGLRPEADPVRREMEELAAREDFPIVGPDVGALLHILARATGARRVLELGSGFGYSALWIARAIPEDGVVFCTDVSAANRDRAIGFLTRAGVADKVRYHVGDALEIAATLGGEFDFVFSDVDKEQYPATIEPVRRLLRPGGLFLTDNALWYGKVTDPERADEATKGVLEFNRRMAAHADFVTVILPLRDGIALAVRR